MFVLLDEESGIDMLLFNVVVMLVVLFFMFCLCYLDGIGGEVIVCGCMLVKCYWGIVGKILICQQLIIGGWVWFVVFILWIMCKVGLQNDQFLIGVMYVEYVIDVCDYLFKYFVFVFECMLVVLCFGDFICIVCGVDCFMMDLVEIQVGRMLMYCDFVVEVDFVCYEVKLIGGNVQ